jgi:hypoxanthine phosphoribosyltransferase
VSSAKSREEGVPEHYSLVYTETAIQKQVKRIGSELSTWCKSLSGDVLSGDVLAIPVLRGGIYFFADVTRSISASVEVAPGRARAYEEGHNARLRSEIYINLDGVSVAGRNVLLVDDICDSGRTLNKLVAYLIAQGAESVRSAVLILRETAEPAFTPDWCGFRYKGDEWFVGYGMDDQGRYSNLPQIYTIEPNRS